MPSHTSPLSPPTLTNTEIRKIRSTARPSALSPILSRRRSQRFSIGKIPFDVEVYRNGEVIGRHTVHATNISMHGLGFHCGVALLPGTKIGLTLPLGPNQKSLNKYAIVRRCACIGVAIHDIGVEFCQVWLALDIAPTVVPLP